MPKQKDTSQNVDLVETAGYGAHHFISTGEIETAEVIQEQPSGRKLTQIEIRDNRRFERWEKIA